MEKYNESREIHTKTDIPSSDTEIVDVVPLWSSYSRAHRLREAFKSYIFGSYRSHPEGRTQVCKMSLAHKIMVSYFQTANG